MKKDIAIRKENYSLTSPNEMTSLADVLKKHIVGHKLYTNIMGKNYAHVEGWQFAGGMLGLFPRVKEVKDISKGVNIAWFAEVEIINIKTQDVVSSGFAICSKAESKKKTFDEYAILSMAQTRAIGKAYRNMLGWVMKLAGYEGTPSEEMTKVGDKVSEPISPNTVVGPEGKNVELCQKCDSPVDQIVAGYSKKVYGKVLCRNCQKISKRK